MTIAHKKAVEWLSSLDEWQLFIKQEKLSEKQEDQFARYMQLLLEWNEVHNLTSITKPSSVIRYHFQDSLKVLTFIDSSHLSMIADVGSGGGFPGIPLSIVKPDIKVILIEVSQKKIAFLETVIDELRLTNVEIYEYDWRTFLRTTDYPVDLVVARASLQPKELLRMFKPGCHYKDALLVYWASKDWEPDSDVLGYMVKKLEYQIKHKKRALILMKRTRV